MSLETFTGWIKDLIGTNPAGGDPKSQGDDHIRGIKQTLKNQFSGLTTTTPVTVTAEQLNQTATLAANLAAKVSKAGDVMTGPLRVAANTNTQIGAARASNTRYIALSEEPVADVCGIPMYRDDGSYVGHLVRAQRDAAGGLVTVFVGAPTVPLVSSGLAPTPAADDGQLVTTSWAQRYATPNLGTMGPTVATNVTGAFTRLILSGTISGRGRRVAAQANLIVSGTQPAATMTILLRMLRASDFAELGVKSFAVTHPTGTGLAIPIVMFFDTTEGVPVVFELGATSTATVSIAAFDAVLTVQT